MKAKEYKDMRSALSKAGTPEAVFRALRKFERIEKGDFKAVAAIIEKSPCGDKIDALVIEGDADSLRINLSIAWRYEDGEFITCGAPCWTIVTVTTGTDGTQVFIDCANSTAEFMEIFDGLPYDLHESYFEVLERKTETNGNKVYKGDYFHGGEFFGEFEYIVGKEENRLFFECEGALMESSEFAHYLKDCRIVTRFPAEEINVEFFERLEIDTAE